MFNHFSDYFIYLLQKKLFKSCIVLGIFSFRIERSNIFFFVSVLQMLCRPIDHEDGLKEGICRFSYSRNIAAHKYVDC
jgi:hypothetical protein